MARRYWVDWSDHAYPAIRPEREASGYADLVTLTEAKREIYNRADSIIDHWTTIKQRIRALRADDIKSESEGER
ncbi:hypothetical protein [Streptantibioticus ferralitis]|uniref:Uncharacterized protein n=1 Tax=Streptantibioticus ferralitis TaxID=236510 RepID=A0ABT5Z3F8_9ACTN|nr:hypothetical protein [Streptantibioticus ferralitis]MDF2258368.1 hypothetical protein [Streptantibioticus ferralitis]